ncbi:MAG: hypothetical protein N2449_02485 [Bacteroidales bacterium]|nr:hypothetical protein [Bacteroidales bacterium]
MSSYRILLCPLDWGLGHVARMVPLIYKLQSYNATIYIACNKRQYNFLTKENITFEWLPCSSPEIRYSKKRLTVFSLVGIVPKIIFGTLRDRKCVKRWKKKYSFHLIISDNRYGCYDKQITSVIITHQIRIKLPKSVLWAENLTTWLIRKQINNFHQCWIPDVAQQSKFAGELSTTTLVNAVYVGILSRFAHVNSLILSNTSYEVLAIISGPEPQRSIFAQIVLEQMKKIKLPCVLVLGDYDKDFSIHQEQNVTIYSYANTPLLFSLIQSSKFIVARSGYSTIMDLFYLKRTAILVPTPGQTEQEYLASYYKERRIFVIYQQENFDLEKAIQELSVYSMNYQYTQQYLLDEAIKNVLFQLSELKA